MFTNLIYTNIRICNIYIVSKLGHNVYKILNILYSGMCQSRGHNVYKILNILYSGMCQSRGHNVYKIYLSYWLGKVGFLCSKDMFNVVIC